MQKFFTVLGLVMALLVPVHPSVQAISKRIGQNIKYKQEIGFVDAAGTVLRYPSLAIFNSYAYNNLRAVKIATTAERPLFNTDRIMGFREGTIVEQSIGVDAGVWFAVSDRTKVRLATEEVIVNIVGCKCVGEDAPVKADISWMQESRSITAIDERHPAGMLVWYEGTVYYVSDTYLLGIPNMDTITSWGYRAREIRTAHASDMAMPVTGVLQKRPAGQYAIPESQAYAALPQPSYVAVTPVVSQPTTVDAQTVLTISRGSGLACGENYTNHCNVQLNTVEAQDKAKTMFEFALTNPTAQPVTISSIQFELKPDIVTQYINANFIDMAFVDKSTGQQALRVGILNGKNITGHTAWVDFINPITIAANSTRNFAFEGYVYTNDINRDDKSYYFVRILAFRPTESGPKYVLNFPFTSNIRLGK
jgi:hypothetical protein